MIHLFLFFLILSSCESLIYDDYKIIDFKKSKTSDYKKRIINQNYLVEKGDNLYSISRKFRIPIQDLIKANNILEPFKIYPNQKIFIPTNQMHKIQKGDTLYSISRRFGTNVFLLSKLNNISNVNSIRVGQNIIIPAQSNDKVSKNKTLTKKDLINKSNLSKKKN